MAGRCYSKHLIKNYSNYSKHYWKINSISLQLTSLMIPSKSSAEQFSVKICTNYQTFKWSWPHTLISKQKVAKRQSKSGKGCMLGTDCHKWYNKMLSRDFQHKQISRVTRCFKCWCTSPWVEKIWDSAYKKLSLWKCITQVDQKNDVD